ncbi:MAG TPA: NAD(P)H-hydrate dehydratase [Firmicutes bacterium]|nr:NAD(P)H-hydrate dehydratase [Bacillota bacterium]
MREVEKAAVAGGLDYLRLMENAGSAAAKEIRRRYPVAGRQVAILCGKGNNGGDGFVIARKLQDEGAAVTLVLVCGQPQTEDAREMYARLRSLDIGVVSLETEPYIAASSVKEAALIVDAVYGIGFHGRLPDPLRSLFRIANASPSPIVAVDVPSGLNGDTGEADEDTLHAALTVTFTAAKTGLKTEEAAPYTGDLLVAEIGIDAALLEPYGPGRTVIDWPMVRPCFPPRKADANKGDCGRLLAFCGSTGMLGAAMMAAQAALRCGVGLLTAALPRSLYPIAAARLCEPVFCLLEETEDGDLALSNRALLREQAARADALLIGCGLGSRPGTEELVLDLLASSDRPTVLDADGINILARHIPIGKTGNAPWVLTPHPGEMARLTGLSIPEIQANRQEVARRFAREHGVTVVLKGRDTVVASPDETVLVNPTGNPGMATGGSGDVLAGIIASFLAQGMNARDAAMCGVFLHGAAGDRAAERLSQHAMLPTDLIGELGALFLNLEK